MQRLITLGFWCSVAGLTIASLVPVELLPPQAMNIWDKAQHALGFAWLALLGLFAYPRQATAVVAGLILWGGLIELMQLATSWRYGEWIDWLADTIGVLTVWLAWRLLPERLRGRVLSART
ncbi:MAG: VanZ family protein [Hydrogenophaga sp.]|uniref:VanZ family protein n=1 Tax=Hydrogenophaga sp. TaxID=1904254 RepID=UPI0016BC41EC|nr:VanZ family protein [Hydrogenophaga sp.]NIM43735.1 VanZ family protein [Hydrogenophaga sp.]NIN28804.1 VanZ family protein [Hydrogenophaga sp.]NIN33263.1 VanZ family protein [Hydrogenophaga sp.]NIN57938.1 VanZ family protein [Hydrogenophaga sp.]NIO54233.1 VanZ family protein [Hydrogenophaga sp.]